MRNFTAIRSFVFDRFRFMSVKLFDEGNELIWFDGNVIQGLRNFKVSGCVGFVRCSKLLTHPSPQGRSGVLA